MKLERYEELLPQVISLTLEGTVESCQEIENIMQTFNQRDSYIFNKSLKDYCGDNSEISKNLLYIYFNYAKTVSQSLFRNAIDYMRNSTKEELDSAKDIYCSFSESTEKIVESFTALTGIREESDAHTKKYLEEKRAQYILDMQKETQDKINENKININKINMDNIYV